MGVRNYIVLLGVLVIGSTFISCKSSKNLGTNLKTTNSRASIAKPYVILISLDGFRWDYVTRFKPPNLSDFIQNGVNAESLIPSFPTKTFPNHYTIVTGMYPENHGILGNIFFNYAKNSIYNIRNRNVVEDGNFYGGTPIWVQADKAKMVSSSFFFVGTEADVQGIRPTYYYTYDGNIKNEVRVTQALDWLKLPKKERPHIMTLYFSDMDTAGHNFGANNDVQLKKALFELDNTLGILFNEVKALNLPVNIIIVSDHGMADVHEDKFISIETVENDNLYSIMDNGSILNIHPKNKSQIDAIYNDLKSKEDHFKVYKTSETPGFEYTPKSKNWGSIQVVSDYGFYFSSRQSIEARKKNPNTIYGVHGYDSKYKDMHGIFYANGPVFKKNIKIESFKNIHIYPLMCKILGLKIPENIDGQLEEINHILINE